MKNFFVVGNPIEHSFSPKLHNYWIKKNKLIAQYNKKLIEDKKDLKTIIDEIRNDKIHGINVTIPYKQDIIHLLDELSPESSKTKSVNTIFKRGNKIICHNTDIAGFELALRHAKFNGNEKKAIVIGAGGVVPSIVYALRNLKFSEIYVMNRTISKAEKIKKIFDNIKVLKWGEIKEADIVINATSLGLKKHDRIDINFEHIGKNKLFFDVIYNPSKTHFLEKAEKNSHKTKNGLMMFIYQAHQSFTIWHDIMPQIDDEVLINITR